MGVAYSTNTAISTQIRELEQIKHTSMAHQFFKNVLRKAMASGCE